MGYVPPPLPPSLRLRHTIATQRGDSRIWSCRSCGSTIAIPHRNKPTGSCPGCTMLGKWYEVHPPISNFAAVDEVADAEDYDRRARR